MGKIFNDLSYGNLVPTYAGLPLDAVKETGNILDTRYRKNKADQDQLEIMIDNLDVRDQNRPHVQQALENARQQLADIKEGGDWENAGAQVASAAKEFAMDKGVRGALKDKAAASAYMADLEERMKDEKIDINRYNEAKALAASQKYRSCDL